MRNAGLGLAAALLAGSVATAPAEPPRRSVAVRAVTAELARPAAHEYQHEYQQGMTLWSWTPTAYAEPASDRALAHLKDIGVDWVTFVPTWFQAGARSSTFGPRASFTPTDTALRHAIASAKKLGLQVTVKPHVDRDDGGWRGDIRPARPHLWFRRYAALVRHYAALARTAGAGQFVVGTELYGVSGRTADWRGLVRLARSEFPGRLTYAALPFEHGRIGFWDALDAIGVDAYWPLASKPTTDVAALRNAWAPIVAGLRDASEKWGRPVLLTEAGYASQVGTATEPSSWTLSTRAAPVEQAAAYAALLDSFEDQPWFAGVHWWAWRATGLTEPLDFTPQGKPAEALLRERWG